MSSRNTISQNVLEKIRHGRVSMHSREYFVLRACLAAFAGLAAALASLFLLSFVLFSVHASGLDALLGFGDRGVFTFLLLFPWLPLVLCLVFIFLLEFLLRRFTNAYRFSLLRIFLLSLAAGSIGGILLGMTPLHPFLLMQADHDRLPILGSWYEQLRDPHEAQGVYRGIVRATSTTSFVMTYTDRDHDIDDGTWTVIPPNGFDLGTLVIGARAYVAGAARDNVVYAYGIRILPADPE